MVIWKGVKEYIMMEIIEREGEGYEIMEMIGKEEERREGMMELWNEMK